MKRSPMRRSTVRMKRKVRMGQASRRRVRAGGVTAKGRPALSVEQWNALKAVVWARARGCCEYDFRQAHDAHHVVKRSQGGPDHVANVVALCRACHERTDAPYSKGRLCITAHGDGRFTFQLVWAADKQAAHTLFL